MTNRKSEKSKEAIKQIKILYKSIKPKIETRLREFERIWEKGSEGNIFSELVFCLLTPQSKARSCDSAVCALLDKGLILKGSQKRIARELSKKTRFHNNKAKYVVEARRMFTKEGRIRIKEMISDFQDPIDIRDWLVRDVKGLGLKEASHFLRNIGFGKELAILDRHILKNLIILGVIPEVPKSLARKNYLEIEKKMLDFSKEIKIPLAHLDLLLWYKETGEVFK